MSVALEQPVVIENKPGVAENIGINTVAKAKPDGYTSLLCSNSITINPTFRSLPYDVKKEFRPVGKVASVPLLIVSPAHQSLIKISESSSRMRKSIPTSCFTARLEQACRITWGWSW